DDFFFQAEDGIRDATVTGVQTCALPIFAIATALVTASGSGAKVGSEPRSVGQLLANEATDTSSISPAPAKNSRGVYRRRLHATTPAMPAVTSRPPNTSLAAIVTIVLRVALARARRCQSSGT